MALCPQPCLLPPEFRQADGQFIQTLWWPMVIDLVPGTESKGTKNLSVNNIDIKFDLSERHD